MTLAAKLAFEFDKRVQFKGLGLSRGGAIRIQRAGPDHLFALVTGSQEYTVNLAFSDGRLEVSCDCPYFAEWGPCKHLWAAVLEADRRGSLAKARDAKYLKVVETDLEEGGEDDDPFEEEEIPPYQFLKPRYQVPPPPQLPAWEEHLSAIRRGLQQHRPRVVDWPKGFEIWYAIDVSASKAAGAIVLDLLSRSKKKNGDWTVYKELRLAPGQSGTLPDAVDRESMAAIFGGQEYFSMQYSSVYGSSRKSLPPVLALKLLPQLAATGRMAFRADAPTGSLQGAGWDDGEPWKLWLDVRQDDRDQWKITGSLRRGDERMDLSEPLLLLESGFVLARGLVARFDHNGAFAWVMQLRNVKGIPFPDRERDQVIGKLLECAVIPPLDIDEALRFEQRKVEPKLGLRVTQKHDWD